MVYGNCYNYPEDSLPGGADFISPEGDGEEPTWAMQPQIHPSGVVPSDEVLMKSLYKHLLRYKWELQYKPAHDYPDEYVLPPSLLGHNIWLQRRSAFFRAHEEIRERDVYVAKRRTFLHWIEQRFRPETAGVCGATQDLCFIIDGYVFWVDPTPAIYPPAFDPPPTSTSGYYDDGYSSGSYHVINSGPSSGGSGSH